MNRIAYYIALVAEGGDVKQAAADLLKEVADPVQGDKRAAYTKKSARAYNRPSKIPQDIYAGLYRQIPLGQGEVGLLPPEDDEKK